MSESNPPAQTNRNWLSAGRVLVLGIAGVVVVLGLILVAMAIGDSEGEQPARVDALAGSSNECVECHRRTTPGIVQQYGVSTMAAAEVECEDCHEVEADYPGAVEHEGTFVLRSPTSAMCETCHQAEVAQYNQSRHSIPAYAAMVGLEGLTEEELALYHSIPEAQPAPNEMRNALFAIEGPAVTRFACESCHSVGAPPRMDRWGSARSVTCATNSAWNRRASPKRATPATSGRTIPSGKSTRSRRTASPT